MWPAQVCPEKADESPWAVLGESQDGVSCRGRNTPNEQKLSQEGQSLLQPHTKTTDPNSESVSSTLTPTPSTGPTFQKLQPGHTHP
jgi:hypothetical protein